MPTHAMESHAEKPSFTEGYPADPALDALLAAFAHGDYATVRADGRRLAEATVDASVRDAARELVARTSTDPLARGLVVLSGALLVFLTTWWLSAAHPIEAHAGASLLPVDHTTE